MLAILAAIPWILPWDEITVPYLPIFHVVSSITPWVGSTLYHLFMNHNTGYIAYKVLLTIDMLGIWVTQTAGKHLLLLLINLEIRTTLLGEQNIHIRYLHSEIKFNPSRYREERCRGCHRDDTVLPSNLYLS